MKCMIRAVAAGLVLGALPLGVALSSAGATTACSTSTGQATCTTSATATIKAGTLTIEAPAALSWADTLSGDNQNVSASLPVSVIDATGSGAGWKTEVAMTHLKTTTAGTLSATVTLNSSSSTVASTTAPTASCGTTSTCALNVQTPAPSYPLTVPQPTTATTLPTAVAFETAKATTGMGTIKLPFDAWLHIKGNAKAGTFTGTVQVSVVSGP